MIAICMSVLTKFLVHKADFLILFMLENWIWLLFIILVGHFRRFIKSYMVYRPKKVLITGLPTVVGQWFTSLSYHLVSSRFMRDGYSKAGGKLFAIPTLDKYHVFVSNREQISEISNAPITQLSFNNAIDELLHPHLLFDGFEFDPKDRRHAVPVQAMKVQLRDNLPYLIPILQERLDVMFQTTFPTERCSQEWLRFSPHGTFQTMVEILNNMVLAGQDLANDPVYLKAAMRYTRDVVIAGEILRFTPLGLQTSIGWLAMSWSGARSLVHNRVTSAISDRMNHPHNQSEKPRDFLQWIVDGTRKKSPQKVAILTQNVMGLLFGGAHQLPMVLSYALHLLCEHPEYLEPLRDEAAAAKRNKNRVVDYDQMVLMDSFLKETARLNPTMAFNVVRKVLSPFEFADGTIIPANNWIVVPQQARMHDAALYKDPLTFNGFRFVNPKEPADPAARFSNASVDFTFWGGTKSACPGRFYVAVVAKMIFSELILNYDFKLANSRTPRSLAWSYAIVPHPLMRILVRKRAMP